jgi:hypothetical protein
VVFPSTVLFVASHAGNDPHPALCLVVDFRRIRRVSSGLGPLTEFDLSTFNEESVLKQGPISTKIYKRLGDQFRIVMKSICLLRDMESEQLQKAMETLMNLRHRCIPCLIGFVLPSQSQSQWRGFEIGRLYC